MENLAESISEVKKPPLLAQIEALIFASSQPLSALELQEYINNEEVTNKDILQALTELSNYYNNNLGGFILEQIPGKGYQFRSQPHFSDLIERMYSKKPRPLSRAAQETLAIIAYRQPTTRAEIEFIRGVDAGSIIKNLLERDVIKCVGRKEIAGRPMLFATTSEFLRIYNLKDLKDLPPLESFQPQRSDIRSALSEINANNERQESELSNDEEGF